jgi:hypothetical protein
VQFVEAIVELPAQTPFVRLTLPVAIVIQTAEIVWVPVVEIVIGRFTCRRPVPRALLFEEVLRQLAEALSLKPPIPVVLLKKAEATRTIFPVPAWVEGFVRVTVAVV